MRGFWNVDNPVWKFIGRLYDFFFLSLLWLLFSLPIVTLGASTTALYDIVLKMAEDKEGKLLEGFWHSFKANLRPATCIWLLFLVTGIPLALDLLLALRGSGNLTLWFFFTAAFLSLAWLAILSFVFALTARVENTPWNLIKMAGAMVSRNILPILTGLVLFLAFISVGVFLFWPVLLVVPALPAYLSGKLFLRILEKYGLTEEQREEASSATKEE